MAAATTTKDELNVSELYKSFPLPPNSKYIRLLEVHPDLCPEGSGPIKANLHVTDLEERPSFSALSYVWGNDVKPHTITCGAFTVEVTENCHSALQNLRKKLGKFTIWIDAICINQDNNSERAQQILLMERIYSGAEIVYVWLGEGNARSDRAIAYLAKAGFLEYFSPDSESTGDGSSESRVWAALWSLIASLMKGTNHPYPTDGKLL
jgi:Heterokaryon incompatibility protein (HET)